MVFKSFLTLSLKNHVNLNIPFKSNLQAENIKAYSSRTLPRVTHLGSRNMCDNYVIYDCDGGSDDAWALQMLLKAELLDKVRILGVTTVTGNANVKNATTNILRILKAMDRLDIPVFKGAPDSLLNNNLDGVNFYHGANGFGGVEFTDEINTCKLVQNKHAVEAIYEAVSKFRHQVTIISVGPQTNVALCLVKYGEKFAKRVRQHYVMGGNFQGVGNSSGAAEFNFFLDPEAASIVLTKARSPIVILPWEACGNRDRFFISVDWRLNVLASIDKDSAFLQLLNTVERAQLIPKGYTSWEPCDAMLVSIFLFGSHIVRSESNWKATVELNGSNTRGQMVLDHLQNAKTVKNIRLIERIDESFFKTVARWAANSEDTPCNELCQ